MWRRCCRPPGMGAEMDDDHPPTPLPRRITEPLTVRPPLPEEEADLIETRRRLDACRARLALLAAQVANMRRAEVRRER
jgi:hypothetical protein